MNQTKALIIKEWHTHKRTLITPLFAVAGFYAVVLLGLLINLIKGHDLMATMNVGSVEPSTLSMIAWVSNLSVVALIGLISIISALSLSDNIINGDHKKHCEILHLSQPLSILKLFTVKYMVMILGSLIVLFAVALVNALIMNSVMNYVAGTSFVIGMTGMIQGYLDVAFALLFVSSLYWMFATIFKSKPFFKGTLAIFSIEVTIRILNYLVGWQIPSIATYLIRLSSVTISFNDSMPHVQNLDVPYLISMKWSSIAGIDNLMKVVYSAICFVAGYFIFKKREVL
ncbi:MAG: hypothetical protein CVU48_06785 [Candidatus Cloacimonetes bacterium HGW-Cloacimonetes-1]|jgi:ABC-type transport system involved in multi-copper enzyme maturation permease subunit|nr:MAG: hypothetical protein CVU48_06785 [Candidatus Cloacimonetes bacterium HGW-Cloacimonetes-1]